MTQEVLIPKMKRVDKKQRKPHVPLLNIALIFLGTLLIIGSTFINFSLKHYIIPSGFFSHEKLKPEDYVYCFSIIPQIPALMFVCSALGKKLATTSASLYLFCGLFIFPVFALGGGISYITEYSFGYLLAYIPAVIAAGNLLKKGYTFLKMIAASICAVIIIHLCGIIYMSLVALIRQDGGQFISAWIEAQSGLKIIYDCVLSFIAVLIGKYFHSYFKFISQ